MMNCQSEARLSGLEYEKTVSNHLTKNGYRIWGENYLLRDSYVRVDFVAIKDDNFVYVEAKGGRSNRSGAKRTNNVKNAISDASMIKFHEPKSKYVVYFSEKAKSGSTSDMLIRNAINAKLFDEVRYVEYDGSYTRSLEDFFDD